MMLMAGLALAECGRWVVQVDAPGFALCVTIRRMWVIPFAETRFWRGA